MCDVEEVVVVIPKTDKSYLFIYPTSHPPSPCLLCLFC
jgi:hypothetical protein